MAALYKLTLCVSSIAMFVAISSAQTCSVGSYRCQAASGQSASFFQCDAGGTEVLKTCAPGTVCYTQGTSILCSYPVKASNSNSALTAGASCSYGSLVDEYMCPGDNGVFDYYLRCLSGNYVHFSCPPGTVCIKNPGQAMYCGWKNQAGSPTAPAQSSQVPVVPSAESSTVVATSDASVQSSSLSSLSSSLSSVLESSTTSAESAVLSSIESSDIYSTSSASASDSSSSGHGLFDSDTTDIPGFTSSSGLVVSVSWGVDGSTSYGGTISFSTGIVEVSSGETAQASSTADQSSTTAEETNAADASSSASSSETPVETTSVPSVSEPTDVLTNQSVLSPAPTGGNTGSGLSGPMISSGLEMLLNNGVHLPVTLPDIELPAINLATVHLPDMTFDGIALTAIPLPSVTLPPFNPASLTKFSYIEELMSKAHISFDDLAKLPLPDLHNLDLSHLGGLDANAVMSMVNVNRVSFPRNMVPTPVYIEPENIQQTTTLDASGIDALMGLSIITYSTQ